MGTDSGSTRSVWMEAAMPAAGPLAGDATTDVCVIGAGMAGLSVAYELSAAGRRVIVVDDGAPAGGETARTTAHLSSALDDRFQHIERVHGAEGARTAARSHHAAIDRIGEIAGAEGIGCEYERLDGYLILGGGDDRELLEKERDAATRAGLEVELIERAPLPFFETGPALRFAGQGQFHPLRYLAGLSAAITRLGGRIHSGMHADEVHGGKDARVTMRGGATVRCGDVVVATNTPVNDRVTMHTKQAAYRSYVVAVRVPAGSVPRVLLWDTNDPYHYVRVQPGERGGEDDTLIVGGEDHKTGQADDGAARFARLEAWTRERFPMAGDVSARWSGQVMEPADSMGFIGRNPGQERVYIATGDSGHGMTHGAIAGVLIRDLVLGRENPWAGLYDPARKPLRSAAEFVKENVNTLASYADWVLPDAATSVAEIRPGEGAVVRSGLKQVACFKDEDGTVHRCSAMCPHLGAVVRWNSLEKTWDCPAHGSRFDARGGVVNGPANADLERREA